MASAVTNPAHQHAIKPQVSWFPIIWFSGLVLLCYAPMLLSLARQWSEDQDMGHGFFVPLIAGWIVWRKKDELLALGTQPNWWGLVLVAFAAIQLYIASLGAELFLARTAFVISIIGIVMTLGGIRWLRALAFPLFLLFFMIPIPAILYNRVTFPLQLLASQVAAGVLTALQIPVLRDGNVLELADRQLSVVEACSGIRSLLSLSFLCLVYGYFFERRIGVRVLLLAAAIPVAIVANAGRVALTGILTSVKPELAEGFFHTASGWVIFMAALALLIGVHQVFTRAARFVHARRQYAFSR